MLDDEPENLLGPYVATEVALVEKALLFAQVGRSDRVLDLGSGDGRFCIAAVQQFDAEVAVGVDIDEELVKLSQARAEQCEVSGAARFLCADLTAPGVGATVVSLCGNPSLVIVFLLPEAERKFEAVLMSLYEAGARVLSLAFELDRIQGLQLRRKEAPMYLYSKAEI
ncbi:g10525 [Coccomyxa elongata]